MKIYESFCRQVTMETCFNNKWALFRTLSCFTSLTSPVFGTHLSGRCGIWHWKTNGNPTFQCHFNRCITKRKVLNIKKTCRSNFLVISSEFILDVEKLVLPHELSVVWPVCPWVLVPDWQGIHALTFVPLLYVFTGQTSQALLLLAFRYDPLGQTKFVWTRKKSTLKCYKNIF